MLAPLAADHAAAAERRTAAQSIARLYRTVRAVEAEPERMAMLLCDLLCDIFDPLETTAAPGDVDGGARVSEDGSTLRVPLPDFDPTAPRPGAGAVAAIALRFAQRGRSVFTLEDAQLADCIVAQLQRAVAHDEAVEQGRTEERLRLAQDLHDDIGARLLTLMYKSQSPEMEEYVRHTLQDLKTLTRGLAVPSHRLSDASAEWKADLGQRLAAAHLELRWRCHYSDDIVLSVVQWSALTRILRELLSNVIAHADARRVEVDIQLAHGRLELAVSDDGIGRHPAGWSHGLGLGGVRKRVKQLDGEVNWRELAPRGIACEVRVNGLGRAP